MPTTQSIISDGFVRKHNIGDFVVGGLKSILQFKDGHYANH